MLPALLSTILLTTPVNVCHLQVFGQYITSGQCTVVSNQLKFTLNSLGIKGSVLLTDFKDRCATIARDKGGQVKVCIK
jgi:hypothetical protein